MAVLGFLLLLSGCRSLGPVKPVPPEIYCEINRQCRQTFLDRPWLLVQSVTAFFPDGGIRNAMAITRIYPADKKMICVITSLEGIVLLNAEFDKKIKIIRAVPPFDSKTFAETLFDDMRLAFLPPGGRITETGYTPSGEPVCRYERQDKDLVEVLFHRDGRRIISLYSRLRKKTKTITSCYGTDCGQDLSDNPDQIPGKMTIEHHGFIKYRLELALIRAEALGPPEKANDQ